MGIKNWKEELDEMYMDILNEGDIEKIDKANEVILKAQAELTDIYVRR